MQERTSSFVKILKKTPLPSGRGMKKRGEESTGKGGCPSRKKAAGRETPSRCPSGRREKKKSYKEKGRRLRSRREAFPIRETLRIFTRSVIERRKASTKQRGGKRMSFKSKKRFIGTGTGDHLGEKEGEQKRRWVLEKICLLQQRTCESQDPIWRGERRGPPQAFRKPGKKMPDGGERALSERENGNELRAAESEGTEEKSR